MISGKSFADRCEWVFDPRYPERKQFSYTAARSGDWVFVNGDYVGHLMSGFPLLAGLKTFTFVVHNSDLPFGPAQLRMMLPHAAHIYAINTIVTHPRLTTIPLGFVDKQLPLLSGFRGGSSERPYEIYANFSVQTNNIKRMQCLNAFRDDSRLVLRQNLSVPDYLMDLCKSKFVLCPEGTGMDTHRVYESLLCGATPVVLRNSLSSLYEKLPVCIVDNWTDPFVHPPSKAVSFDVHAYLLGTYTS